MRASEESIRGGAGDAMLEAAEGALHKALGADSSPWRCVL